MINWKRRRINVCQALLIGLLIGLNFGFSCPALAFITVSTFHIELEIPAGETNKGSFEVINTGEKRERVRVYLGDWNRDVNGNNHFYKTGTVSRSLSQWIEFSPREFELEGGQTRKVKFTVSIPKEKKGTYWAIFFVEGELRQVEVEREGQKITFGGAARYGIKIYQTDPATADKEGKITRLDVIPPNNQNSPIKVKLQFESTGNVHLKPTGRIEFRDETGKTIAQIKIKEFPILPGDKRILELTSKNKLLPGKYVALAVIDFQGDHLVAGQRVFEIGKGVP